MDELAHYLYDHETITGKEFMRIFRKAKGIPEPVDTSDFTTSEKVAESVTFNEDGTYSSTINGPSESEIWKNSKTSENATKETSSESSNELSEETSKEDSQE